MRARTFIFIGLAVVVLGAGGWFVFGKSQPSYQTATVTRGAIAQEALASGHVESPTTSQLRFKSAGKLVKLSVAIGDTVTKGEVLAKQDTSALDAQFSQAQASVTAAKAALAKLEAGATPQTVAVASSSLQAAQQTLANAYANAPQTLADAYAKARDATTNQLALFFNNGGTNDPTLTFTVSDVTLTNRIESERAAANVSLDAWKSDNDHLANDPAALDAALSNALGRLGNLRLLLSDAISAVARSAGLTTSTATTYRTYAATGLSEVNAAISSIQSLQQSIKSAKAGVDNAAASLALTTAGATREDLQAASAKIAEAQANADAIKAQIQDLEIIAPFDGTVTDTNGSVGETLTPDVAVVSLMPKAALDVKVNVSEDNIVGVKVGDHARIELDAFPSSTEFSGTVSKIDPAETVIGGAVYYQTTVLFDKAYPGIRSGMTANVWITTASSTDALMVPASALSTVSSTTTVRVIRAGAPVTTNVTTGIQSQDGMVQILSGLSRGDTVITGP